MAAPINDENFDSKMNFASNTQIRTKDTDGDKAECSGDAVLCVMCMKEVSRYTCPRCNVRYCSSTCYKHEKHADCSEAFYKDCFMEGLQDCRASGDDREEMMEMLKRLQTEYGQEFPDEGEEEEEETLEERMQGLDLDHDTAAVLERLTARERREFEDMLSNGSIGHLVPPWAPWWMVKDERLVKEMDELEPKSHPPILGKIPNIKKLTKTPPSDCLAYTVINVLYGYAYTARLHNGDHMTLAVQAAEVVVDLCESLGERTFSSAEDAVHGCLQCLNKQTDLSQSREFNLGVLRDVSAVLTNGDVRNPCRYILAALSDCRVLLLNARKLLDPGLRDPSVLPTERDQMLWLKKRFLAAAKKMEFLLSWVKSYGTRLVALSTAVDSEFCVLTSEMAAQKASSAKITRQPKTKRKVMVEEISESLDEDSAEGKISDLPELFQDDSVKTMGTR